jgi:RND family efflux transporter MFP subunit
MNILSVPGQSITFIKRAYGRSPLRVIIASILIAALIAFALFAMITHASAPAAAAADTSLRTVHTESIADLTAGVSSFSVVGNIESNTEASVRTESAGQITGLYHSLGDSVGAGTIIAEMDNASQRASVLQAEGGLQAAQAALAKTSGSARPEQLTILQSAAQSARAAAANALLSAYGTTDDSVHHTADALFSNPDTYAPTVNLTVTDSQLPVDLQNGRVALGAILTRERSISGSITPDSSSATLHAEIATTETEVRTARSFFDTLIAALGKSITTQSISAADIAAYKTNASAARSALTGVLSSLSGADAAITAADQNLAVGTTGGATQDVAGAQAGITQAEGGLAAARAALEKTIIRAPISGTINMLDMKKGDFEQIYTPVVTIANNHALEIVAYVSEDDAARIAVGDTVTLEQGNTGTITKIAPALDPTTKNIEVRIGLPNNSMLTNGQSVTISFEHSAAVSSKAPVQMVIPLAALKISADTKSVFTVDADGTLVSHDVTIGSLLGDRVVILTGISAEDRIVTDARGLRAGDHVIIK